MNREYNMAEYINGKELLEEMKPWLREIKILKKTKAPQSSYPQIPEKVGKGIMQIVEGLGRKSNFSQYTYRDEMMSDAILNCVSYLHNFNLKKSNNIFAYVTQIAYNSFIKRIQLEQKHVYQRDKLSTNVLLNDFVCAPELEKMITVKTTAAHKDYVLSRQDAITKYELFLSGQVKPKKKVEVGVNT